MSDEPPYPGAVSPSTAASPTAGASNYFVPMEASRTPVRASAPLVATWATATSATEMAPGAFTAVTPSAPTAPIGGINVTVVAHTLQASAPVQEVMVDTARLRPTLLLANGATSRLRYVSYATHKPLSCTYMCCGCCKPCRVAQEAQRRATFVAVYDTKIEFNEPVVSARCLPLGRRSMAKCDCALIDCRCCNHCNGTVLVSDDIRVIHFDRAVIQFAARAGCMSPAQTHNLCCPDCCGLFGESIVLYERQLPCCACSLMKTQPSCTCCEWDVVDQGSSTFTSSSLAHLASGRGCCGSKEHRVITHVDDAQKLVDAIVQAREAARAEFGPVITGLTREEAEKV